MDYEPAEYQRLQVKKYAPRVVRETAEGRYWSRFKAPVTAQQVGAVTHIDFCPAAPHDFAVTSSTRVVIYSGQTRSIKRTIGRFKDKAYAGNFRADGKLLVAGGETGVVQVFDTGSRDVLRQLKGHQRAVHAALFAADKTHVLSASDDVTVRLWDITAGSQVVRLTGHTDYVRTAAASPLSTDNWLTGSYDHTVKLWDTRSKAPTLTADHGAPVESVAMFPSGALAVSAGGSHLCVWDLLSGGRLLKKLTNFQKTVTSVLVSPMAGPDSSAAPRVLAASLDGHLKVFELDTFKVTHAMRYPAPIMSAALSPDCSLLAVGTSDGTLSVRKHLRARKPKAATPPLTDETSLLPTRRRGERPALTAANYRYFLRGQSAKAAASDFQVAAQRRAHLADYDRYLRRFEYRAALDAALETRQQEVVASVLQELSARGGLQTALGNRDAAALMPLLRHVLRHITDPRHLRMLTGVALQLVDIYAPVVGQSSEVDEMLGKLRDKVVAEMRLQATLVRLQGCLEPILAAAVASNGAAVAADLA